jgi:8-oxo-dGTP diphosphatase
MRPSLHLIRHAHAGSRSNWDGDDQLRPLSDRGDAQAAEIADALVEAGIDRLVTSRYVRCRQTLEPLATELGLPVEDLDELAEGGWGSDALDVLLAAVAEGHIVAACSHGDVIPAIVATAVRRGAALEGPGALKKGARYECHLEHGQITLLVAVAPPDGAR